VTKLFIWETSFQSNPTTAIYKRNDKIK